MENINDNELSARTQNKMIAAWLQAGSTLTSLEALRHFGCMRLASRIYDLRSQHGMDIRNRRVKTATGKTVCEYYLNMES